MADPDALLYLHITPPDWPARMKLAAALLDEVEDRLQ
jgi:hypothetical protein